MDGQIDASAASEVFFIRRVRSLEELHAAFVVIGAQFDPPIAPPDRRFDSLVAGFEANRHLMLVAECDGRLVGGVLSLLDGESVGVSIIGFDPSVRGMGLARRRRPPPVAGSATPLLGEPCGHRGHPIHGLGPCAQTYAAGTPGHGDDVGHELVGRDLELTSLDECIADSLRLREMAVMLEHDDPIIAADERWPATWFSLLRTSSARVVFLDCDVADGDAAPVHHYYSHDDPRYSHEPKAASLADAVALWVNVLERGLCAYDPASGRWIQRWEDFDERLRLSGLV